MPVQIVIDPLEATDDGPVIGRGNHRQRIFLNQGDIDGACGPYCVMMALIALRISTRKEVLSLDGNKGAAKNFLRSLAGYMRFVEHGTTLKELAAHLKKSLGGKLAVETSKTQGEELIEFTIDNLLQHRPVILGLDWNGGGHWVLAIGVEYATAKDYEKKTPRALLVLDPAGEPSSVSVWNNIIEAQPTDNTRRHRYRWWGGTANQVDHVAICDGLALWRRT